MDERRITWAAGAFGLAAVGLFVVASVIRAARRPPIRLVAQTDGRRESPIPKGPPGIYLLIESERARGPRSAIEVVDANDRVYPSFPLPAPGDEEAPPRKSYLWVPFGYATPSLKPRLRATKNGNVVADIPLKEFPPPTLLPLGPTPPSPVRLVRAKTMDGEVVVVARRSIPPQEEWRVRALGTNRVPPETFRAEAEYGGYGSEAPLSSKDSNARLRLPYLDPGTVVRIKIEARRPRSSSSQTIRVPGMRLARRNGETEFVLPRSPYVVKALGLVVSLTVPPRPLSAEDHRSPRLAVRVSDQGRETPPSGINGPLTLDIRSPHPEDLAVSSLAVGSRRLERFSHDARPTSEKPFDLVLAVSKSRGGEILWQKEYNVRVEPRD